MYGFLISAIQKNTDEMMLRPSATHNKQYVLTVSVFLQLLSHIFIRHEVCFQNPGLKCLRQDHTDGFFES